MLHCHPITRTIDGNRIVSIYWAVPLADAFHRIVRHLGVPWRLVF
jgi:hypothetical protein